jgi:hypothetical protein
MPIKIKLLSNIFHSKHLCLPLMLINKPFPFFVLSLLALIRLLTVYITSVLQTALDLISIHRDLSLS